MLKKNFVSMLMGAAGGIPFALGMCMCLLPQWNAFQQGVVLGTIGGLMLLAMVMVRRRMEGKPAIVLNAKAIGTLLLGIVGALGFGAGMCLVMVWGILVPGIVVGIIGMLLLLCLVPICKGLK